MPLSFFLHFLFLFTTFTPLVMEKCSEKTKEKDGVKYVYSEYEFAVSTFVFRNFYTAYNEDYIKEVKIMLTTLILITTIILLGLLIVAIIAGLIDLIIWSIPFIAVVIVLVWIWKGFNSGGKGGATQS